MKINPHATVVPFLVMVDLDQRPTFADFKYKSADDYTYYVVVKIIGNGVKIAWNRQKREGAMCTCGRGNGHMCTLVCCKYDLNENREKKG